jgi:hypothetical protein
VTKNYTYTEKTPAHRASDEHAIKHPGELYGLAWSSHYNGFVAGDAHGYQRAVSGASPDFMTYKEFFCKEDFETLFPNQDAAIDLWVEARLSCAKEVDRLKECLAESRQGYEQRIAELETLVEMVLAHDESQQRLDDAQKLARELKTGNK